MNESSSTNDYLSYLIRGEIEDNEQLLWEGRPPQGIVLRRIDFILIPFGTFILCFITFWMYGLLRLAGPDKFIAVFGIVFWPIGCYLAVGRFFWDSWRRAGTIYAVTSKRVIIAWGRDLRHFKSIPFATLHEMTHFENRDGSGTIDFKLSSSLELSFENVFRPFIRAGWMMSRMGYQSYPWFELPADVKAVYELIQAARETARRLGD